MSSPTQLPLPPHCCRFAKKKTTKRRQGKMWCGVSYCPHVWASLFPSPVLVSLTKSHWCLCRKKRIYGLRLM